MPHMQTGAIFFNWWIYTLYKIVTYNYGIGTEYKANYLTKMQIITTNTNHNTMLISTFFCLLRRVRRHLSCYAESFDILALHPYWLISALSWIAVFFEEWYHKYILSMLIYLQFFTGHSDLFEITKCKIERLILQKYILCFQVC